MYKRQVVDDENLVGMVVGLLAEVHVIEVCRVLIAEHQDGVAVAIIGMRAQDAYRQLEILDGVVLEEAHDAGVVRPVGAGVVLAVPVDLVHGPVGDGAVGDPPDGDPVGATPGSGAASGGVHGRGDDHGATLPSRRRGGSGDLTDQCLGRVDDLRRLPLPVGFLRAVGPGGERDDHGRGAGAGLGRIDPRVEHGHPGAGKVMDTVGLRGGDYRGYSRVGDGLALSALLPRCENGGGFLDALGRAVRGRRALTARRAGRRALQDLLRGLPRRSAADAWRYRIALTSSAVKGTGGGPGGTLTLRLTNPGRTLERRMQALA